MSRLTPLAKALITIIILALSFSMIWNLGLKDSDLSAILGQVSEPAPAKTVEQAAPIQTKEMVQEKPGILGMFKKSPTGPLGSENNPIKVSIVSFHGYAPALVANGQSLKTLPGSIFAMKGVNVEFIIQDDIPTLTTIFESGTAHCAWRTSDFWAQEHPNLQNTGYDARAIMVVDNTQGADAIIATDPAIKRVEDLATRSVALLQYTPSDGMVIDAIDNSSLTARAKKSVRIIYINADEGTAGVRAALEAQSVDAAALWDPDLSLALQKIPGAHVIYSTKTATNLIYDVIVCDSKVLDKAENQGALEAFVSGWMAGVTEAEANPDLAVEALVKTEEFFALLARDEGRDFVKGLFDSLVWTGLEDNARILGLAGGTNYYEQVYKRFDVIYRHAGALANPKSPVINPQQSFDYRYIRKLLQQDRQAQQAATQPEYTFSTRERDAAARKTAVVTKPVIVNFKVGSASLTKRAERTINQEMVPFIEGNGSAYFIVSGNTDSTGSRQVNMRLSKRRARTVVDYLINEWEFDRSRFVIEGHGPDQPLCDESNPATENISLDECRKLNRSTRVAVLSR